MGVSCSVNNNNNAVTVSDADEDDEDEEEEFAPPRSSFFPVWIPRAPSLFHLGFIRTRNSVYRSPSVARIRSVSGDRAAWKPVRPEMLSCSVSGPNEGVGGGLLDM